MRQIEIIPSKSDAHRALICEALSRLTSGRTCLIQASETSLDIAATEKCLQALLRGEEKMYCGESGSTLRFLLPVMGALNHKASFFGEGRLPQRPLSPLYEELESHGCSLSPMGSVPLTIRGQLKPGYYKIPGNVSSQYISGLLFALPLLKGGSRIDITGKLESEGYVKMTLKTLKQFGIEILTDEKGFTVPGGQAYRAPESYQVEGDWSNGCFWLAAGALTEGGIRVKGLSEDSLQADKEIIRILKKMGADVKIEEEGIAVSAHTLWGTEIDASQIPDMVPVLAVLACGAKGKTVINNAGRLRIKESDRLASVACELTKLGAEIEELPEGLVITGKGGKGLSGGSADSWNDHRIAMMAAVASLICREKVVLSGSRAVQKSYPNFFEDLKRLGLDGNIECTDEAV